jgi:ketosteroid isomerase-like protein
MKKLYFFSALTLLLTACASNPETPEAAQTEAAAPAEKPPVEFADAKLMDQGKAGLANLSKGDVAAWMNDFADNAVYVWNSGDSLAGKQAISDYWTDRRNNVLESISFSKDIWLPVIVNAPQNDAVAAGTWLLSWYKVDAKYKATGKTMTQWIHSTMHFNEAGKIDRLIQYVDRAPIAAAMAK